MERGQGRRRLAALWKFRASRPCAPLPAVECLMNPGHLARASASRVWGSSSARRTLEEAACARPRPGHLPRPGPGPGPGSGRGLRAPGLRGDTELAAGEREPQEKAGVPGGRSVPSPPAGTSARRLCF